MQGILGGVEMYMKMAWESHMGTVCSEGTRRRVGLPSSLQTGRRGVDAQ